MVTLPFETSPLSLAAGFWLVAWWKAILILVPFVAWAGIVTRIYDKHAARFHLARESWNAGHLIAGLVALGAAFLMPIPETWGFWVGLATMVVILAADLVIYAVVANRDERVPEEFHISLDMSKFAEARAKKAEEKRAGKAELVITKPDRAVVVVPNNDTPEFQVRLGSEAVFLKAREARATQVDLRPSGKDATYVTAWLIDGVRHAGEPIAGPDAVKIIDFWKAAGGLDVADRRRRLTADFKIDHEGKRTDVRLTTSGTQGGMQLTLLFDPQASVRRKFNDLGLLENQVEELRAIVADAKGLVLVVAPLDQGRTTTLYSLVKQHDAYTQNVQTVESEISDAVEGVRQNLFNRDQEGAEYATLVRSILRRDPDIVAVAELPDAATAKELSKLEIDRTRVYLGITAEHGLAGVAQWLKHVGDNPAAARVLHGVIAQRLVRRLCQNCRVAYSPSPDMLKKLGLPVDKVKQLYKKGGQVLVKNRPETCSVCRGIGYVGQLGVFEAFSIDDAARELLSAGNLAGFRAEIKRRQLPTIQQVALRRAVDGDTSVEEVVRVTTEPERKPAPAPAAAAAAPKS